MTDTKKHRQPVFYKDDKGHNHITSRLDNDLVEKIMNSLGQYINLNEQHRGRDAFKAEISKLLQSRQPEKLTVKEEDIKEWHEKRDDAPQSGDWIVENDLIDLVKFLGIKVAKK